MRATNTVTHSSCSVKAGSAYSSALSLSLSRLVLASLGLEYAWDVDCERSNTDGGLDLDPILDTFPLSPPLPGPELPSRTPPTLTFDIHCNVVMCDERPPANGPRLIVPTFPLSFTLAAAAAVVGTNMGRERACCHSGFSSHGTSTVFLRPVDSRGANLTGR